MYVFIAQQKYPVPLSTTIFILYLKWLLSHKSTTTLVID